MKKFNELSSITSGYAHRWMFIRHLNGFKLQLYAMGGGSRQEDEIALINCTPLSWHIVCDIFPVIYAWPVCQWHSLFSLCVKRARLTDFLAPMVGNRKTYAIWAPERGDNRPPGQIKPEWRIYASDLHAGDMLF